MHDVFLFVLGYYFHLAAACILIYRTYQRRSIYGLSPDTQIAFLLAVLSRCYWTLDTRLVETYLSYLELICSVIAAICLSYLCFRYYDTAKREWTPFRIYAIAPAALASGFLVHPGDTWMSQQVFVSFTIYLEAMAMLPQLWLMRQMHEIEAVTSHYVALLVVGRGFRMLFWGMLFWNGEHFLCLFAADVIHTAMCADFMYLWFRKLQHGGPLVYSSASYATNV